MPSTAQGLGVSISIHAPAGGASSTTSLSFDKIINFNSRPCGRGFGGTRDYIDSEKLFQFTPLREGLLFWVKLHTMEGYFNSRPCGRGFRNFLI